VLSIVIAFALLAFILSLKAEMGFTGNDPKVGVMNGEKINYSEYYNRYEQIKAQSGMTESDEQQSAALANATWQSLIASMVIEPAFEQMGFRFTDEERMALLMKAAGELPVTFHRAFDVTRDAIEALEACKRLGISTILTSGQKSSAVEGLDLLKELVQKADGITIMPGSGVSSKNLPLLMESGATAYHMSAKKVVDSPMNYRREGVPMGLPMMSEFVLWRCDGEEVAKAKSILEKAGK
jgi:hypothetical protein